MYEFTDDAGYVFSRSYPPAWALLIARDVTGPAEDDDVVVNLAWLMMELER